VDEYDIVVIGGGIVGISTAWQLKKTHGDAKILLIEKENSIARHQTGHNSGVIHAGVYYQPGSLKADFCKRGATLTTEFCDEYNIPYERCGKMLVATNQIEYDRMQDLEIRCEKNGITTERLSKQELSTREPSITGSGAIFVAATGITDYQKVTKQMADLFKDLGGRIILGKEVKAISENSRIVTIQLERDKIISSYLLACAGLQADRVAKMIGIDTDFKIIPFRGEYYQLPPKHNKIVNHLIYPIPDPDLPFLGVHLTRMVDGTVTVGPNAVLGYKREGYGKINFNLADTLDMFFFPGFWKVIKANLKSGIGETIDSWYRPGYLKRVQKYCPEITISDLAPYPAGIRAQAVMRDGSLVHDFLFRETERSLHVCNAPSPAATSAIPIGEYICTALEKKFDF
jgi:L-2-hydroxyglutarate oxidase